MKSKANRLKKTMVSNMEKHNITDYTNIDNVQKGLAKTPVKELGTVVRQYLSVLLLDRIIPALDKKPRLTKDSMYGSLVSAAHTDFHKLLNENSFEDKYSIWGDVGGASAANESAFKISVEILNGWYANYGEVKPTSVDEKGFDRIIRIHDAFIGIAEYDYTKPPVTQGQVTSDKKKIVFQHKDGKESMAIHLVDKRKVITLQVKNGERELNEFGGSVSSTTLKEIKEHILKFANQSENVDYWKGVHKLVSDNI